MHLGTLLIRINLALKALACTDTLSLPFRTTSLVLVLLNYLHMNVLLIFVIEKVNVTFFGF